MLLYTILRKRMKSSWINRNFFLDIFINKALLFFKVVSSTLSTDSTNSLSMCVVDKWTTLPLQRMFSFSVSVDHGLINGLINVKKRHQRPQGKFSEPTHSGARKLNFRITGHLIFVLECCYRSSTVVIINIISVYKNHKYTSFFHSLPDCGPQSLFQNLFIDWGTRTAVAL